MDNIWKPKNGELVQLWDAFAIRTDDDARIKDHGRLAYIMRESKRTDTFICSQGKKRHLEHITEGDVFKCIMFGLDSREVAHVHIDNLRQPRGE